MTMAAISNLTATAHIATDPIASPVDAAAFSLVMAGLTPGQVQTPAGKDEVSTGTHAKRKEKSDATDVADDAVLSGDPTTTGATALVGDPAQSLVAPMMQPTAAANTTSPAQSMPAVKKDGRDAVASTAEATPNATPLTDAQIRTLAPALQFLEENQGKKAAPAVPVSGDADATTNVASPPDPVAAKPVAPDPKGIADHMAAVPTTSAMLAARGPMTQSGTQRDTKGKDRDTDDARSASDDKAADAAPDLSVQSALPHHAVGSIEPAAVSEKAGQVLSAGGADRQLDLAKSNAWLDGVSRDIAATSDSSGTLRFGVAPTQLGAITVELKRGDDGTSVTLTASSQQAHAILSDAKPQLVAQAQANGIRIADAQVDLGGQSAGQGQSNRQSHADPEPQRSSSPSDQSGAGGFSSQSSGGGSDQRSQTRSQPLPEYRSGAMPSGETVSADLAGADRDPDGLYA